MLASSKDGTKLQFRKYIFLPLFREEYDFKSSNIRMRLISYQILDFVQNEKFYLQFKDYCLYAALFIHLKFPNGVKDFGKEHMHYVAEIVPHAIFKSNSEKEWSETTKSLVEILGNQIQ
jgi:hypothetical protein